MRKSYKVGRRTYAQIKDITARCREILGLSPSSTLRMVEIFRTLARREILKTGRVVIKFMSVLVGKTPAYVTYNPTTLHVDFDIWMEADQGEPFANFILAHELGHVILHDHSAQPYSGKSSKAWDKEEDSEWQADCFADELLLTDEQATQYATPLEISIHYGIPKEVAQRRLGTKCHYVGEPCGNCGNFTLLRDGNRLKCDTCGKTTPSW